jgi:hypothetical protein
VSITFSTTTLGTSPDGPVFVDHPSSRSTNFATASALRVLSIMGVDASYCGSLTLEEATRAISVARSSSELYGDDRLRVDAIYRVVQQGRLIGATHLSWA